MLPEQAILGKSDNQKTQLSQKIGLLSPKKFQNWKGIFRACPKITTFFLVTLIQERGGSLPFPIVESSFFWSLPSTKNKLIDHPTGSRQKDKRIDTKQIILSFFFIHVSRGSWAGVWRRSVVLYLSVFSLELRKSYAKSASVPLLSPHTTTRHHHHTPPRNTWLLTTCHCINLSYFSPGEGIVKTHPNLNSAQLN